MAEDQLPKTFDGIRTRIQADLDAQLAAIQQHYAGSAEQARREAEADAERRWSARLDEAKREWTARGESERKAAAAALEQRLADEVSAARHDAERATAAAAQHARAEIEQTFDAERQRLHTEIQAAREQADAAVRAARERARQELDQALLAERQRSQEDLDAIRQQADAAVAAERERAQREVDAERHRSSVHELARRDAESALAAERLRAQADLETARQKAEAAIQAQRELSQHEFEAARQRLTAQERDLSELRDALARERDDARADAHARHDQIASTAVIEARAVERQSQLAALDRLLGAVRAIGGCKSLSETLTSLVTGAAAEAPRAALFIVNGGQLQRWKSIGFGDDTALVQVPATEGSMLGDAIRTGEVVSSATKSPPVFAALPADRAALAVPVTVGGQPVAVVYADDVGIREPEAPASWPEAIQILGRHASSCLAHLTALRTAQTLRSQAAHAPHGSKAPEPTNDEDNSARRYARLLVSEIKLYNESAVRVGRERRDLLERLGPEIERARRLYEERVPPSINARGVYFQQELVQTLADGDPGLLGGSVSL